MKRTLVPNSLRSAATRSSTSASTVASRPVVGSSRMRSVGSEASAIAMTTRCWVPPESWCGYRRIPPAGSEICTLRSISCARSSDSRLVVAPEPEHFGDLVADADRRVQRRARVLVDHRDRRGAQAAHLGLAHRQQVLAVRADRAGDDAPVPRQVAHDRERGRRLAAARLADEPVRLALLDRDREPAEHRPVDAADAVDDLEVLELDGGVAGAHRSKVCAMASAIRLMPTISVAIARDGKRTAHQMPPLMNA